MARKAPENPRGEEGMLALLEQAPLSPICLLSGEEGFFVERCVEILKRRILTSPDLADILYYPLYGSETTVEDFIALARTPPFFDKTQLVLVREAERLKGFQKAAPMDADVSREHETERRKKSGLEKLAEYADKPSPFTCLVLVFGKKLPAHDVVRKVQRLHPRACLDFPMLKRAPFRRWVARIAEEQGLQDKVSPGLLSGLVGEDEVSLLVVERRMESLALYLEDGDMKGLDADMPPAFCSLPEKQAWLLTDALMTGDREKALSVLHRLLEQGSDPLPIFGRIVWAMRRIQRVQEAIARDEPLDDVFKAMRVDLPLQRNSYSAAARRIPPRSVHAIFSALLERDRTMKLSKLPPRWHLEGLCIDILDAVDRR